MESNQKMSTRVSTKTTGSNPITVTTRTSQDIPPSRKETKSQIPDNSIDDSMLMPPPTMPINEAQFHELFNQLLARVETMIKTINHEPTKTEEDQTVSDVAAVDNTTQIQQETPAPLVGVTETRGEKDRKHSIFSTFKPPRISTKLVQHSIDQLENWLDINNITDDHERFMILKMSLETDAYRDLSSALTIKQTPGNEYKSLKQAIIQTYSDSEAMRIKNLLSGLQLGDRKPSQLLAEMCHLYPGPHDAIFEELFLNRLPINVRGIVVTFRDDGKTKKTIQEMAQMADTIMETMHTPKMISTISDEPSFSAIEKKIEIISEKIEAFTNYKQTPNKFRPRSFGKANYDNDNKDSTIADICFFHRRYGNNRHENKRCIKSCRLFKKWREAKEARMQQKN